MSKRMEVNLYHFVKNSKHECDLFIWSVDWPYIARIDKTQSECFRFTWKILNGKRCGTVKSTRCTGCTRFSVSDLLFFFCLEWVKYVVLPIVRMLIAFVFSYARFVRYSLLGVDLDFISVISAKHQNRYQKPTKTQSDGSCSILNTYP